MHLNEHQLNDYVDGLLDREEVTQVEQHIASCADCSREVAALRALVGRVSALPRDIAPDRDLRSDIRHRIEQRSTVWRRYQLAAAAIILVALSSLLTLAIVERTRSPGFAADRDPDVRLVSRDAHTLQREYADEVRELEMILRKSRGTLAPATIRILEENLKIIDDAIGEAQAALASDPNSEMLVDLLRSAYERKLQLLRQAAKSSPVTT